MAAWCTNGTGRANHARHADSSPAKGPQAAVRLHRPFAGGAIQLMGWPAETAAAKGDLFAGKSRAFCRRV